MDKEIDLEEEYQFSPEEGTERQAGESSAPRTARNQGSAVGAGGETERKAGIEANAGEPSKSGSAA